MSKSIKFLGKIIGFISILILALYIISFITRKPIDLGFYSINARTEYHAELDKDPLNKNILRSTVKFNKDEKINIALAFSKDKSLRACESGVSTNKLLDIVTAPGSKEDRINNDLTNTCTFIIKNGKLPSYKDINSKNLSQEQFADLMNGLHIKNHNFDVNIGGSHYEKSLND